MALEVLEAFVRGGLGSGVGGLRALTGVLRHDLWDMSELRTLSACGGGSTWSTDLPSCEAVGGVGGRPVSAPFRMPGEARGVLFWLQRVESLSSPACVECTSGRSRGTGVEVASRSRSGRLGKCLEWRRLGAAWKDDSSLA